MKRLILMRHAKAMIGESGQADRDRALSPRGFRDVMAMANILAQHTPLPDRILCSSARRTRETLAALLPSLNANFDATVADALYDTTQTTYADIIKTFAGPGNVVLIIGHNPTIHATAANLVGSGPNDQLALLSAGFPTASLAIMDFRDSDWTQLQPGSGILMGFFSPREKRA